LSQRVLLFVLAALLISSIVAVGVGYKNATATPVLRQLHLTVPNYPPSAAPVRIVLFSDVHVHGPDMPPARLSRIVDQINSLRPDIVVGAGDFVGNHWFGADYSAEQATAPLARLKARFGVYAVLGNNDYQSSRGVAAALERVGVHVLLNDAVPAGPIAVGGIDGRFYKLRELKRLRRNTYAALERTRPVRVLIAHRPDEFAVVPPTIDLVLAGHTHCGQIVLPFFGAILTGSDYGRRYVCGVFRNAAQVLVVTAGLGTSHVPLRIGAPPDLWLITITGRADRRSG
jgi:predicted MPP superfamily phosphohydrolase